MTDTLTVRVYNVRFGDAILVTVPDRGTGGVVTKRRILIDVGNAPRVASADGGDDRVFEPVVADILRELDGAPLDLYVMTHEHLDHVQGLFWASVNAPHLRFAERFRARHVWMTASAAPDYYDRFPEAKKKRAALEAMHARLAGLAGRFTGVAHREIAELLANNDPTKTKQCVAFLRTLAPDATAYVHRGAKLARKHPFREAKLKVWAPEEDASDYYGSFQPLGFGEDAAAPGASVAEPRVLPPAGVDVGAFLDLVETRRNGVGDNLLTIDKAANNTSVVFALEWRKWRLLFAGDAELRSWRTMAREKVLRPVHFLKVAHHGSHNGTPEDEILDRVLPTTPGDGRPRRAAISTWDETYSGIPHPPTNARLAARCELRSNLDAPDALYFDVEFPDLGA